MNDSPFEIIFLGVAERVSQVADSGTNLLKLDILGLKAYLLSNFFPLSLRGFQFCFAIRGLLSRPLEIKIMSSSAELGRITLLPSELLNAAKEEDRTPVMQTVGGGWIVIPALMPPGLGLTLGGPGNCKLVITAADGVDHNIGEFSCFLVDPPPLTLERVTAIRSDPFATKAVRVEISCVLCATKLRAYAGLEHVSTLEAEGYVWAEDLPERFECRCKATEFDLQSIKRNLRPSLGARSIAPETSTSLIPLYNHSALMDICRRFSAILDRKPKEEVIQIFIAENPILLHQFPSIKILIKPNILGLFAADFAIFTSQKELVFIEIEKADTRLLRKDGGEAADLTHAFDQVRNWLHVVAEHRLAVLAALDILSGQVSGIRGVVIAGRDQGQNPEHLRRLKGANRERISFLTFDDLTSGLASLADKVGRV